METNYFWDAVTGTCLAELDENGDVTVKYTVNPQTGELISENHSGEEVYHHYDGDGNTRQTTDSNDNVLRRGDLHRIRRNCRRERRHEDHLPVLGPEGNFN